MAEELVITLKDEGGPHSDDAGALPVAEAPPPLFSTPQLAREPIQQPAQQPAQLVQPPKEAARERAQKLQDEHTAKLRAQRDEMDAPQLLR